MTKLVAYFDDSGTHANSDVTLWAGFIGTPAQWTTLNEAWAARLRAPLPNKAPLRRFSVGKCRWTEDDFERYTLPQRDELRRAFRDIIAASGVHGVACAVDVKSHANLIHGWHNYFVGDPETMAVGGCQWFAQRVAEQVYPGYTSIAFHFDQGRAASARNAEKLTEMFSRNGKLFLSKPPSNLSLSFEKVADHPGLQAADTLATELYWHLESGLKRGFVKPVAPHFQDLQDRVPVALLWQDEDELREMVRRLPGSGAA